MSGGFRRQPARGSCGGLCLHPRRIKKLNEGERQQDQQEDHAGHHHNDRKNPPQIALKRDVAKPEGGHDREGPVKARHPTVLAALPVHDHVEDQAVNHHHDSQHQQKPGNQFKVAHRGLQPEKSGQLGNEKFHAYPGRIRPGLTEFIETKRAVFMLGGTVAKLTASLRTDEAKRIGNHTFK